jgi:hypothetical protein
MTQLIKLQACLLVDMAGLIELEALLRRVQFHMQLTSRCRHA